jgi:hypothetical protein
MVRMPGRNAGVRGELDRSDAGESVISLDDGSLSAILRSDSLYRNLVDLRQRTRNRCGGNGQRSNHQQVF